eukprot:s3759_g3.t1
MAKQERLQQLDGLVERLRRSPALTPGEASVIQKELVSLAKRCWAEDEEEDEENEENDAEMRSFDRLEEALLKLPEAKQQAIVAAFRPLRAGVSRRLSEWTNALNDFLSDAGNQGGSQAQHLGDLLREVDSSPQSRWYRQCPKPRVKAKFLMAIASLARALIRGSPLLKPLVASHPAVLSLAKKIVSRLFVLREPGYGDTLERWHEGRLAVYNATISLAAQRAAEKLKDDLQVSLVSAVKRSANPSAEDGKAKASLQLQLRDWPMSGCPLARALLEFLKSRAAELGDLGRPSLRECPPHSLQPETLRQLLSRLDAFEIGGADGIVRLRFEAVAALAFKAVGTKPKAGSVVPPTTKAQMSQMAMGKPKLDGSLPDMADFKIDYSDANFMMRLIKRGLRSGDEEWRQAWAQFCWKKNLRTKLSVSKKISPPKEALAAFLEANLPKLRSSLIWEKGSQTASRSRSDLDGARRRRREREREPTPREREPPPLSESWSSSFESESEPSERSRRRKKRRKEKKSLLGYADFFNKSKHMTPEVMMMRAQMMGFSMVMDNPLAMMGMRPPMMTPSMNPMLPRPEAPGRPYAGHVAPPPPAPPPSAPPPAPSASPPPSAPVSNSKPPLPKSAVAAARKQQESTIDMDDL